MKTAAAAAALACLLLTACGPFHRVGAAAAHISPGVPVASAARVASGVRTSPSPPTPAPPPPPLTAGPCRLPMAYISEAYGWFVSYPGGRQIEAPDSQVALPGGTPGAIGVNPGLSYDRAAHAWLPVGLNWVAPSGHAYVYEDFSSHTIKSVTVPGGAVQVLAAPAASTLIGTSDSGAYAWSQSTAGTWFLPLDGSAAQQVTATGGWLAYNGNALWGLSGPSNGKLIRHDLTTGSESVLARLNGWNDLLGFDAQGDPLFSSGSDVPGPSTSQPFKLIAVHPGGKVVTLWSGSGYRASGWAIGDAHGVWFELSDNNGLPNSPHNGLYLWTAAHGAKRIAPIEGNIGGPCA